MDPVQRFDTSKIVKYDSTPQGFIKVKARLSRVGIFQYKDAQGKITREFRPPEEVFAPESLASFAGAPVTDLHPQEFVGSANVKALSIGFASENPRQDGDFVASSLTIQHGPAIESVKTGNRKEISCGYSCVVDHTPGVWRGQKYDSVQRQIRGNHVAIGPSGWGRQGSEVSMRLDSKGAICADIEGMLESDKSTMDEKEIKALQERADSNEKALKASEAKQGALQAQVVDLSKQLDSYKAQERKDARDSLETQARKVLGAEAKFEGQTDRQVQEAAILKLQPEKKLDGMSDDFVAGAFDYVISAPVVSLAPKGRPSVTQVTDAAGPKKTPAQVREEANAERHNRWKLTDKDSK